MVVCIYWWNPLKPTPHKNTIRIHRWSATQFPGNILRCHPLIVCSTNIFSPGKHPDCHYHNLSGSGLQTFYKVTGIMEIKMIIIILVETVETVVLIAYCYNGVHYWFIFYFIYLLSHLSEILVNILSPDNSYLFFGPHESGNVFFIEISPIDMFSIKISSYIYVYFWISSHCNGLIQLQYIHILYYLSVITYISFNISLEDFSRPQYPVRKNTD